MDVNELLDEPVPRGCSWSTGIEDLDRATGGLCAGSLWLVVGTPGQGRSTLLTQVAVHLAMVERAVTTFFVPSGERADVRARLTSLATGAALPVPRESCRVDRNPEALLRLRAAPLEIRVDDHDWSMVDGSEVVIVDDVHVSGSHGVEVLRRLTREHSAVIAGARRRDAISGPRWGDPVCGAWGETADVIVEVDSLGRNRAPGLAELRMHRNNYGPTVVVTVANNLWRAAFAPIDRRRP